MTAAGVFARACPRRPAVRPPGLSRRPRIHCADGANLRPRSALRPGVPVPARVPGRAGQAPIRKECRYTSESRDCEQQYAPIELHFLGSRQIAWPERHERTNDRPLPARRFRARLRQDPIPRSRLGIGAPNGFGQPRAPHASPIRVSRETARASSRLATFTHAISSTRLTAPNSSHSVERTSPTSGRSGSAMKLRPALDFGYCSARLAADHRQLRPRAAASVAPGRRRATRPKSGMRLAILHERRRVLAERSKQIRLVSTQPKRGRHDADNGIGSFHPKPARLPIASGFPPKRRCHKPWPDDRYGRCTGPVVLRQEGTAQDQRRRPEPQTGPD